MWRNYLLVGLRSLAKSRTYAFITIFGLAIGMAACVMILRFVQYETSYDKWVDNAADTYQLQSWFRSNDTGEETKTQMTEYTVEPHLKKDFPQIERAVYALSSQPVFMQNGEASSTKDYLYVDGNFLDVVNLPILHGSRTALDQINAAAMSRSEAVKRFGTDEVVGRTFTLISKGVKRDFKIGAVLRDIPKNSHMRIASLIRIDFPSFFATEPQFLTCWGCQSGWVYVRLYPGTDPRAIQAQMPAWEKRNIPDENSGNVRTNPGDEQDWHFVNIRDVHLGRAQQNGMTPGNDRTTIFTFAVVALLILAMAVVNFTNLATARAGQRAREVALRKVLGASRRQLIVQFIGESVLIAFLAMVLALALVELLTPPFAAFLDADIAVSYFTPGGIALPALALVLVVGLCGGLYPAFFLSSFRPSTVLKANRSSAETPGSGRLRNGLVVGQFAVSIGLIICTGIIYAQTVYARTTDPGYRRDHILQVDELNRYQLLNKGDAIAERVKRLPGVVAVGRTSIGVATDNQNTTDVVVPGQTKPTSIGDYDVDPDFLDAMGLTLVGGRWFDRARPLDDMTLPFPADAKSQIMLASRGGNVVLNQLAARRLGFRNPTDAIGRILKADLVETQYGPVPVTVIGIVKDSRFRSVKVPLEPIMFVGSHSGHSFMIVRFNCDPRDVRREVEGVWKGFTNEVPFNARFSDDIVGNLYKAEDARAVAFAGFALLAVIIACLGLFGLAAFTAERRTKEIGIRKVLGASTQDIVRLLAWQFSKPVLVSNLIAWPVAWWAMRDWLNGFDSHISLGAFPFLVAGALALVIAIGTIAGHALKVARANPILALRYE